VTRLHPRYPFYDVLGKWDSPSWNDATREVIAERLSNLPHRRFFSEDEWQLLAAIADRILPQPDRKNPIPLVPWVDSDLHDGRTSGTRLEALGPIKECWRRGLSLIDAEARILHGCGFRDLQPPEQDALLGAIDSGQVSKRDWQDFPPQQFFRQVLLKTLAAIYYAHPEAWSEIGFGGPAAPRGYARLGLDRRDPWEAEEVLATDPAGAA